MTIIVGMPHPLHPWLPPACLRVLERGLAGPARAPWLAALLAVASSAHAAPDPALLGCWRATRIVLNTPDGETVEDRTGRCTLQFKDEQFESTCQTTKGTATTTYRYRVVRPQVYAATMAGSSFRTDMVGSTREYEYRIEGDQLRTVTVLPAKALAAAATASRVEAEAVRGPCP